MTRRGRRRLFVLGTAAVVGATVPFWVPRLLSSLPAFKVEKVGVVGTRYVPPDEVVRLADISPEASVWDDPGRWERSVEAHPLIRRVRVHRQGVRTLEIRVMEDRPVALAATPKLVPVSAEGRVLPLDPVELGLDLPVLLEPAEVGPDGRLSEGRGHRRLAGLLELLEGHDPAFVQRISSLGLLEGGAVEIHMLESAYAARLLLPLADPVRALRRVELALGDAGETWAVAAGDADGLPPRIATADARFDGQVVLR